MRIQKATAITALLCLGLLAAAVFPVIAQDAPGRGKSGEHVKGYNDWNFSASLGGWAPSLQGDVTSRGNTSPVDVRLDDLLKLLDELELLSNARFEVSKGPWGLLMDAFYVRMSDSGEGQRSIQIPILNPPEITIQGRADATTVLSVGEAALSYDVYASPCLVANMPEVIVEVLGGARYQYLRTKVHLEVVGPNGVRTFDADKSKTWVDPFFGGRMVWRPGTNWITSLQTDFGGFTVSSDFTFNVRAEAAYRINKWLFVNAGYRALYTDYETGSGDEKFAYNMWAHGPFFGVGVEF
ncbi:MAG: hypothetical protein AB9873_09940 [Syntrophobacteraceae bacterium]